MRWATIWPAAIMASSHAAFLHSRAATFLAGTFGAFIKMKSPIPSRRALFDIGLAGPLAGFVVLLPVAVAGLLTLQTAPPSLGVGNHF